MAHMNMNVQFRLNLIARAVLWVAIKLARAGIPHPRGWVKTLVMNSWWMSIAGGPWQAVSLDDKGKVLR